MNLIVARWMGRTEAEMLAAVGAGELRRWYGLVLLEWEEQRELLERLSGRS